MNTNKTQTEQLTQDAVSGSVFYKIMSGNSELEKFRTEEKAQEVCEWYQGKGFPNARVVKTDR
jgi:hypothetical protein